MTTSIFGHEHQMPYLALLQPIRSMKKIPKPKKSDYNEYYGTYVDKVAGQKIYPLLRKNAYAVPAFLYDLPDDKWHYRYADGKWSLAEVIMHLIDSEQVFCYRIMRIARGDKTPLAGFDQNEFVANCNVESRTKDSVIEEYYMTRKATLTLLKGLSDDVVDNVGNASDYDVSVSALCHIIAGHEAHHIAVIKARYL